MTSLSYAIDADEESSQADPNDRIQKFLSRVSTKDEERRSVLLGLPVSWDQQFWWQECPKRSAGPHSTSQVASSTNNGGPSCPSLCSKTTVTSTPLEHETGPSSTQHPNATIRSAANIPSPPINVPPAHAAAVDPKSSHPKSHSMPSHVHDEESEGEGQENSGANAIVWDMIFSARDMMLSARGIDTASETQSRGAPGLLTVSSRTAPPAAFALLHPLAGDLEQVDEDKESTVGSDDSSSSSDESTWELWSSSHPPSDPLFINPGLVQHHGNRARLLHWILSHTAVTHNRSSCASTTAINDRPPTTQASPGEGRGPSSGSSHSSDPSNSSSTATCRKQSSSMVGLKKPVGEDDEGGGGGGNDGSATTSIKDLTKSMRFACPFQKYNRPGNPSCGRPQKFRNTKGGFEKVSRVRRHIIEYHDISYYCPRCWKHFHHQASTQVHVAELSCIAKQPPLMQWTSPEQRMTLQARVVNSSTGWYQLFHNLFPALPFNGPGGITQLYTPFYDLSETSLEDEILDILLAQNESTASSTTGSGGMIPRPSSQNASFNDAPWSTQPILMPQQSIDPEVLDWTGNSWQGSGNCTIPEPSASLHGTAEQQRPQLPPGPVDTTSSEVQQITDQSLDWVNCLLPTETEAFPMEIDSFNAMESKESGSVDVAHVESVRLDRDEEISQLKKTIVSQQMKIENQRVKIDKQREEIGKQRKINAHQAAALASVSCEFDQLANILPPYITEPPRGPNEPFSTLPFLETKIEEFRDFLNRSWWAGDAYCSPP